MFALSVIERLYCWEKPYNISQSIKFEKLDNALAVVKQIPSQLLKTELKISVVFLKKLNSNSKVAVPQTCEPNRLKMIR